MTATPSDGDLVQKLEDRVRSFDVVAMRWKYLLYSKADAALDLQIIDRLRASSNAAQKSSEYEKNWKIVYDWFLCECAETNPATGEVVEAYARKAFNALCELHPGLLKGVEGPGDAGDYEKMVSEIQKLATQVGLTFHTCPEKKRAWLSGEAGMRAFGASEAACYHWPENTELHRACREAYCRGAADCLPSGDAGWRKLKHAAEEFIRKVEAGQARSKQSYGEFKAALAEINIASVPAPVVEREAALEKAKAVLELFAERVDENGKIISGRIPDYWFHCAKDAAHRLALLNRAGAGQLDRAPDGVGAMQKAVADVCEATEKSSDPADWLEPLSRLLKLHRASQAAGEGEK